jgi:hypothetical protein
MKVIFVKLIFLFFLTISSCTLIPCNRYSDLESVQFEPKKSDLVGIYIPDKNTIKGFSSESYLKLNDDSTFVIEKFPLTVFDILASFNGQIQSVNAIGKYTIPTLQLN